MKTALLLTLLVATSCGDTYDPCDYVGDECNVERFDRELVDGRCFIRRSGPVVVCVAFCEGIPDCPEKDKRYLGNACYCTYVEDIDGLYR